MAFVFSDAAARVSAPPRPGGTGSDGCPELDCVRALIAPSALAKAAQRAADIGTGADRVLIAQGLISEEAYVRALADRLGAGFEPLDGLARRRCPLDDDRLIEAAAHGVLPLAENGDTVLAVAPRGWAARTLAVATAADPALATSFHFTTAERFDRFVLRHAGKALVARAAGALDRQWPALSAAPPRRRWLAAPLAVAAGAVAAALGIGAATPVAAMQILAAMLAALFIAWLGLRVAAAAVTQPLTPMSPRLPHDRLPVYTVICALYREAASAGELLAALARLDYPREKLDIVIALEADDRDTRAAIEKRKGCLPVTLVTVPVSNPRTKPKALNAALPFARGSFTVIYDAEDRPEPDQLRRALQAFGAGGNRLACVQAKLCIDNTGDGWLARMFTAEYAGQFDVFLPGLAAMRLPLPLGGSSNHFRTATLRAIGGWDAYNVTEDADLGMRLSRFGHRTAVIASTTYEEAPARLGAWLRQRTRWFKGWMQTWAVHMRTPWRLARELGLGGFLAFQLIVGGNALAALVHPLFLATLIDAALAGPSWRGGAGAVPAAIYGGIALAGYLVSGLLGFMGLKRRGLLSSAWVLLLMPLHWLLLSLAAWRALWQLMRKPYAWEKTEHGLAKSSRLASGMTHALVELERHLTHLKASGQLPGSADR